jgi:hypothetical protein
MFCWQVGCPPLREWKIQFHPYDELNFAIQAEQNENNFGMTCAWNEGIQLIRHDEA